jgi:nucleotide-binding universal stress UspA family protein
VAAQFVTQEGGEAPAAILKTAEAYQCSLIIGGGYGAHPMVELVLGSTMDRLLREARRPVLICR